MISPEEKEKLDKYVSDPSTTLPSWVILVLRHFIEESDDDNRRLIELDEELARTVMKYEEQLSFLRVLLSYSGWYQNEDGEWGRKIPGEGPQGMAAARQQTEQSYP